MSNPNGTADNATVRDGHPQPAKHRAADLAAAVRRLAEFVQANPDLTDDIEYALHHIGIPIIDRHREVFAAFARAGTRAGATVVKDLARSDDYAGLYLSFGKVRLMLAAKRAEVCERVVIGIRQVVEDIPDPEALAAVPTTQVTRTVEDVEWRCRPLLAGEPSVADLGDILSGTVQVTA
jgi:hypothetical protein